ncbi:MAG: DUF3558 family protein [Acidimicrobiia bacterium]
MGILCAAVLLFAACSSEDVADTTVEADAAMTTTTATTSPAESAGAVAVDAAPCSLVTADEVSAAAGLTVVESGEESPTSCVYDFGADTGVAIFVNVDDGEGGFFAPSTVFDNYMEIVAEGSAETVPNLGAAAVYSQQYRGLAVDAGGGRFIALGVNGGYAELAEPRDALVELATLAMSRL